MPDTQRPWHASITDALRRASTPPSTGDTMPKPDRINICPETGRSLDGLDIRAHVDHLWPQLDEKDPRFVEARKRRDALLAEAAARDLDARTRV